MADEQTTEPSVVIPEDLVNSTLSKKRTRKKRTSKINKIAAERRAKHPPLTSENSIVIEQYRSGIRQPEIQQKQLRALGLGRIGKSKRVPNISVFSKIVARLAHLVRIKKEF
jgi:ribosomal protein L30/L7E